jgi:hypothetical protein
MEILGTNLAITLGAWRLRLSIALEETDAPPPPVQPNPATIPEERIPSRLRASRN